MRNQLAVCLHAEGDAVQEVPCTRRFDSRNASSNERERRRWRSAFLRASPALLLIHTQIAPLQAGAPAAARDPGVRGGAAGAGDPLPGLTARESRLFRRRQSGIRRRRRRLRWRRSPAEPRQLRGLSSAARHPAVRAPRSTRRSRLRRRTAARTTFPRSSPRMDPCVKCGSLQTRTGRRTAACTRSSRFQAALALPTAASRSLISSGRRRTATRSSGSRRRRSGSA